MNHIVYLQQVDFGFQAWPKATSEHPKSADLNQDQQLGIFHLWLMISTSFSSPVFPITTVTMVRCHPLKWVAYLLLLLKYRRGFQFSICCCLFSASFSVHPSQPTFSKEQGQGKDILPQMFYCHSHLIHITGSCSPHGNAAKDQLSSSEGLPVAPSPLIEKYWFKMTSSFHTHTGQSLQYNNMHTL